MLDRRSFLRAMAGGVVVSLCPLPVIHAAELMIPPLRSNEPCLTVDRISFILRESLGSIIMDLNEADPIYAVIAERTWRVA